MYSSITPQKKKKKESIYSSIKQLLLLRSYMKLYIYIYIISLSENMIYTYIYIYNLIVRDSEI